MMLTPREIIQIVGVGLLGLGLMVMPRGVPRELPFLKETGFTRMAEAGAFAQESRILLLSGPGVFVISFVPLPPKGGRKASFKNSKK